MSRRASRCSEISLCSQTGEPKLRSALDNVIKSSEAARRISQTLEDGTGFHDQTQTSGSHQELSVSEKLFYCLDTNSDGLLREDELRVFADVTGFDHDDMDWSSAYQGLCDDLEVVPEMGLDMRTFVELCEQYLEHEVYKSTLTEFCNENFNYSTQYDSNTNNSNSSLVPVIGNPNYRRRSGISNGGFSCRESGRLSGTNVFNNNNQGGRTSIGSQGSSNYKRDRRLSQGSSASAKSERKSTKIANNITSGPAFKSRNWASMATEESLPTVDPKHGINVIRNSRKSLDSESNLNDNVTPRQSTTKRDGDIETTTKKANNNSKSKSKMSLRDASRDSVTASPDSESGMIKSKSNTSKNQEKSETTSTTTKKYKIDKCLQDDRTEPKELRKLKKKLRDVDRIVQDIESGVAVDRLRQEKIKTRDALYKEIEEEQKKWEIEKTKPKSQTVTESSSDANTKTSEDKDKDVKSKKEIKDQSKSNGTPESAKAAQDLLAKQMEKEANQMTFGNPNGPLLGSFGNNMGPGPNPASMSMPFPQPQVPLALAPRVPKTEEEIAAFKSQMRQQLTTVNSQVGDLWRCGGWKAVKYGTPMTPPPAYSMSVMAMQMGIMPTGPGGPLSQNQIQNQTQSSLKNNSNSNGVNNNNTATVPSDLTTGNAPESPSNDNTTNGNDFANAAAMPTTINTSDSTTTTTRTSLTGILHPVNVKGNEMPLPGCKGRGISLPLTFTGCPMGMSTMGMGMGVPNSTNMFMGPAPGSMCKGGPYDQNQMMMNQNQNFMMKGGPGPQFDPNQGANNMNFKGSKNNSMTKGMDGTVNMNLNHNGKGSFSNSNIGNTSNMNQNQSNNSNSTVSKSNSKSNNSYHEKKPFNVPAKTLADYMPILSSKKKVSRNSDVNGENAGKKNSQKEKKKSLNLMPSGTEESAETPVEEGAKQVEESAVANESNI